MSSVHTAAYRYLLDRMREARLGAGLTQVDLAQRLGARQAYVSRCELGERRLDVIELLAWADALGQPLDYFLPPPAFRQRATPEAAPARTSEGAPRRTQRLGDDRPPAGRRNRP